MKRAAVVMVVIGVILAVVGVVYLVTPAASLPSWLPGHLPTRTLRNGHVIHPHAHIGRGAAMAIAAAILFVGAWWLAFRYKPASTADGPATPAAAPVAAAD